MVREALLDYLYGVELELWHIHAEEFFANGKENFRRLL